MTRSLHPARSLLVVLCLAAAFCVAVVARSSSAHAIDPGTIPLSSGKVSMISTHADGTSGTPVSGIEGANQVAISDDGTAVAFVSDVPAQDLVTDPTQLARGVSDNNTNVGTTNKGDDVFLYQKPAGSGNPTISLVSENVAGTGTGNAPSDRPVMAASGLGLVFQSSATDMVSGNVGANQNHIYAWTTGLGSLTGVSLIDTKFQSADACNCAATNPSISMIGPLGPTVVFEATGGGPTNELVAPGVLGQSETQIYAHSIVSNSNTLVSVTDNTTVPNARSGQDPDVGNGAVGGASEPLIASDASIVVFTAVGDDLVKNFDSSNGSNIWERNLVLGTTTLVSVSASGDPKGTSGNDSPVISNFGTGVVWRSTSNDVSVTPFPPAQQSQPLDHVYFKSVLPVALPTIMVDTDWTGALACDANSDLAGISGDGLSVVFDSDCSDISRPASSGGTLPDVNAATDVFERTFAAIPDAAPRLLSVNDTGDGTGNGASQLCAPDDGNFSAPCADHTSPNVGINVDGTVVTYYTQATDIARPAVGTPPFNVGSVIVSYPQIVGGSAKNTLASFRSTDGAYADATSGDAVVSKDGGSVAFVSSASDLVPNDTNDYFDVFESDVHNRFFFQPITPVDEGAGSVTIGVGRVGNDGTADSIEVTTGDGFDTSISPNPFPGAGEAQAPGDYTATDKTLTFPPGVMTQTFSVPIIDDTSVEGSELFHVSLSTPGGGAVVPPSTDAYVEILDNDGSAVPDWKVAVSQQPPATAHVGDTVTMKATITVDPGGGDLDVTGLSSGAATTGLDQVSFGSSAPFTVAAGSSTEVMATARVVATPGAAATKLEVSVAGTLDSAKTKTADTDVIAVTDAVTATLTGGPSTVGRPDQITYTVTLTNGSDTDAQLTGLPAALTAPTGTTASGPPSGSTTVAANGSTAWTLTVDVDDADVDGMVLTESPGPISYAMSAIGLAPRPVAVAPSTVSSTVSVPLTPVTPAPPTFIDDHCVGFTPSGASYTIPSTTGVDYKISGVTQPAGAHSAADGTTLTITADAQAGFTLTGTTTFTHPFGVAPTCTLATTTTLSATPSSTSVNHVVTLTATVTASSGTPTGTVQFFVDGSTTAAATQTLAGGNATWTTTFGGGTHTVVATYSGDAHYRSSSSGARTVAIACTSVITVSRASLTVTHGTTCVSGATISGGISVGPGAVLDLEDSHVLGSISVSKAASVRICGSSTQGILISAVTGFVLVGDPANNCRGNHIAGTLMAVHNRGGIIMTGNVVTGTVTTSDNTGVPPAPASLRSGAQAQARIVPLRWSAAL